MYNNFDNLPVLQKQCSPVS